ADYDVTGQAQTGTGKTAAFLITILTDQWEHPREPPRPGTPRALVLAPTRELAMQICGDAEDLARYLDTRIQCVVGGIDFDRQRSALESGHVDIIVATPGRLIDFMQRRVVNLREVEILVIDEADRMLDMGFIPDVRRIVAQTPRRHARQTMFFSATFNKAVLELASQWTLEPIHVAIDPEQLAADAVEQKVYLTTAHDKFRMLFNLISQHELTRVMVFSNRRDETRRIRDRLVALGVDCEMLSGDVPQRKRLATLERFKAGKIRVLVATDVAGRGIHVESVSHVINYNLPDDPEDYVHRIGRTGRAGAEGTSISFACEDDAFMLPRIESLLGTSLDCEHPPEDLLVPLPADKRLVRTQSLRRDRGRGRRRS
ncbi:MAG: DEAD/DEAH box helicase, partial [Gammaproteobacteria bacterium]